MASRYAYGQSRPATFAPLGGPHAAAKSDRGYALTGGMGPIAPTSLTSLIECEVIPRLMVAHPVRGTSGASSGATIDAAEVAAFAPLTLQVEADELLAHIDALLDRGVAVDALLIDLLAPTAVTLGEYWKQDRCDFVDVTMGLWRLQEVVHELSNRIPAERHPGAASPRALFGPVPGDAHSFGTVVVEEWFSRNGWFTDRINDPTIGLLSDRLGSEWFDLVGLTASCDCHIAALPPVITALRSASRNQHIRVMVGGPVFVADPHLAVRVGADGTARDARAALEVAEDLLNAVMREASLSG